VSSIPVLGTSEASFPTIGSTLFNVFFAPFVFVGKTVNRCLGSMPLTEFREHQIITCCSSPPPPGCGKTTLLKALSGKLYQPGSAAQLRGSLKFNAYNVPQLKHLAMWPSYVRQIDEHQALLTTRETLQCGYDCRNLVHGFLPAGTRSQVRGR
jgi:hypothetical protein